MDGLADWDERTIGLAGLLNHAALGERPEAAALSHRLDEALATVPAYEWLAGDDDDKAWAYTRPDHRVRFEAALRIAPFRAEAESSSMAPRSCHPSCDWPASPGHHSSSRTARSAGPASGP